MPYLDTIWAVIQPLFMLFVSIVGPVLVTWIAAKVISYLGVKDAAAQKQIETQIRDALHQSAENGLKAVLAKLGMSAATNADILANPQIIKDAIDYVRRLNPNGADKVTPAELRDIIMSKVPNVTIDNNPVPVVVASPPTKAAAKFPVSTSAAPGTLPTSQVILK